MELGPLDREATVEVINKLKIDKKTGTPIAAALREVQNDLADITGEVMRTGGTTSKTGDELDEELEAIAAFLKYSSEIDTSNWPPNIQG